LFCPVELAVAVAVAVGVVPSSATDVDSDG
jgi:hypothetical protein